jgi:hypothetical protein
VNHDVSTSRTIVDRLRMKSANMLRGRYCTNSRGRAQD